MKYPATTVKESDVLGEARSIKFGCKVVNGELLPAAFTAQKTEGAPQGVVWADYCVPAERYFAVADGILYAAPAGGNFSAVTAMSGEPFSVTDTDGGSRKTYVIGGGKCAVFDGQTHSVFTLNRDIYAGVLKCGRVFGIDGSDKTLLRWSGAGGVSDWTESLNGAGWMRLEAPFGDVLNLAALGDNLVAVHEYGITQISAFGSPENFKQSASLQKTPRIYKNTAVAINGKLYFYTAKGLYCFDGNKICEALTGTAETLKSPAYAAAHGNNYCVCGFFKALNRSAILIYETSGGASYFADIPAKALCAHNGLAAFTAEGALFLTEGGEYVFKSGEITFGTAANKTLSKVDVFGGTVDIKVSNGVVSRIFGGVSGSVRVNLRGKSFKITVRGNEKLSAVKAYAEVGYGI